MWLRMGRWLVVAQMVVGLDCLSAMECLVAAYGYGYRLQMGIRVDTVAASWEWCSKMGLPMGLVYHMRLAHTCEIGASHGIEIAAAAGICAADGEIAVTDGWPSTGWRAGCAHRWELACTGGRLLSQTV